MLVAKKIVSFANLGIRLAWLVLLSLTTFNMGSRIVDVHDRAELLSLAFLNLFLMGSQFKRSWRERGEYLNSAVVHLSAIKSDLRGLDGAGLVMSLGKPRTSALRNPWGPHPRAPAAKHPE